LEKNALRGKKNFFCGYGGWEIADGEEKNLRKAFEGIWVRWVRRVRSFLYII
jgi:hypothetical protein